MQQQLNRTNKSKANARSHSKLHRRAGQFGINITHRNKCKRLKRHLIVHPEDTSAIAALEKYK